MNPHTLPARARGLSWPGRVALILGMSMGAAIDAAEPSAAPPGAAARNPTGGDAGSVHWAFRPVTDPPLPATADHTWPVDPIDRFVLARLEREGGTPTGPASRTAWLRRVWFDLVGLPPAPEAIAAFVGDPRSDPDARADVVDALLAMPQFGERWGRHWLDVARFAESSGGGRTLLFQDAWRYRDYVIEAFDRDMPYDRFLREQVAGDLLAAPADEDASRLLTATGFLVLGPTNYEEQDKYQLRMDIVDEQIDTLGKTVLGMTLGCARCHDHKFDPVPTDDYYAMAGVFRSTRTLANDTDNVARWIETPLPATGEPARRIADHDAHVAELERDAKRLREEILALDPRTAGLAGDGPVNPADLPGIALDDTAAKAVGVWKRSTYGGKFLGTGAVYDEKKADRPATLTFDPDIRQSGRYEVRLAYVAHENRSTKTRVTILHADGEDLETIDQRATPPLDGRFTSLGTFRFEAGGAGFVLVSNEASDGVVSVDGVWFLPVGIAPEPDRQADAGSTDRLARVLASLAEVDAGLKSARAAAPRRPTAMTVRDHESIEDSPIHLRGSVKALGPRVPRGALSVIATVPFGVIPDGSSGRVQLADWLVDRRNPLTSRVMVNRIWLWLFGDGLVRTADNFGTTGDPPTHPELLDHLATRFMAGGWSVKSLVRGIVTSNTYAMSDSAGDGGLAEVDPENRLLSRFPRRRLDAESLRDAMLAAAGVLDMTIGGPNIAAADAVDAGGGGSASLEYDYTFQDMRRSVYTPAFRNRRHALFEVFDFADVNQPVSRRPHSTGAHQALFFMNHPLVRSMAEACARRLTEENMADDRARLDRLCLRILSRPATDAEVSVLLPMVPPDGADERLRAWADVAHALFASVDFRYTH